MQKTAVIIPCYNEAARLNLPAFMQEAAAHRDLHFIFVNDGSNDGTLAMLQKLHQANPVQLRYLDLALNRGKAEAVRQGVREALKEDFINIGYWDADLSTPLRSIHSFCRVLESTKTTIVIGSRVRMLGRTIERSAFRHYSGRVFATFAAIALGMPVYDSQCGAKLFKASDALRTAFKNPFSVSWIFDLELLGRLKIIEERSGNRAAAARWTEYPLETWINVKGSKICFSDLIISTADMAKLCFVLLIPSLKRRYSKRYLDL